VAHQDEGLDVRCSAKREVNSYANGIEDRTMEQQVLFGITTPQHHVTYPELLRVWQAADELGFDSAVLR